MFSEIKQQVQKNFQAMTAGGGTLFKVDVDREKVWDVYLSAFSEDLRQSNNCNCCKSFLRQYGGIVGIKNNQVVTLWDFETDDEEYKAPIKAVGDYIRSLPVSGIFFNEFKKCGNDRTPDIKRSVIWDHFYLELPTNVVKKDSGSLEGAARDNKNVLQRSLNEISDDALDTVLELIGQNSLYRGQESLGILNEFRKIKDQYKKLKNNKHKDNFCWVNGVAAGGAVARIKNHAIGTLLIDLSEGKELDKAVGAFERIVAPANYKRPTALVTPRMIEEAKKRLVELDLVEALNRRLLSAKDLTVNNALFVHRAKVKGLDIFDEMKKDVIVNPKSLTKSEEITIEDFIKKVLPTAKSVRVLVENSHMGNFVSLVGPQEQTGKTLFKWGNNYSFSYTGGVADSMRARVAELGGRVDGVLRFTHSWNHPEVGRNASLMDLHVFMPGTSEHTDGCHDRYPSGQRVGWNRRTDPTSGGKQDVDYTNAAPEGYIPIENIAFPSLSKLKDGKYTFKIHNWNHRTPTTSGFKAEIEFGGQIFQYNHPAPLKHKEWVTLAEVTLKKGVFTIEHKLESKASSQKKWGIDSERFVNVNAITLSPNFWETNVGNKHYFFFLEGCKSDEKTRPFYNEFLKEELSKDRKVFEVLGNKCTVETVEEELSGLGFSETVRNHLIVEVQGAFKRILKIKF